LQLTYGRRRAIKEDVYMTLGLAKESLEVLEAKNETNGSIEFKSLLKYWKE